ncbi:MAG: FAD-dependent oxidoreductase [Phycisphaerae bacterium]|nr:NAD(P)/FAD-dependent oxidoreductase [Phycisphaerae bacterium]NIP53238.1 NAD(P)/FAD-dependent oxidoreductase [Phycisphaerae bacterium]NIS52264.1 NAD(P)/FAD-dependent oxidoreductase [Phycisphaerae bacterium]NIU09810.1 NAD(P)/FAD-dependent oxidoreductase [Phycisphaerae bacterium]NIU59448.1 FAD-dependent oxidoreductase [Phycisphaerae bacterium]
MEKTIVVLGCGPAGLAASYELAKKGRKVICLEKDNIVGGISRTICRNGFRFDIGGHRFFTKISRVNDLWKEVLGNDFLIRPRLSRIYYNNKFFNYPLKPVNALVGLGFFKTIEILGSFFATKVKPYSREDTFEQWVSNRFGKQLYQIFFKTYTEKVWGITCENIKAEWAAQRIKGLSLTSVVKAALLGNRKNKIKTLIEEFSYPRFGPGQMYETMAEKIKKTGGKVLLQNKCTKINAKNGEIISVEVSSKEGKTKQIEGDHFISSIPIDELVLGMNAPVPKNVSESARKLSYRSLLTVNLMINRKEQFKDTWIYIHSPEVQVGRIQCYKNWSPYMVPDKNNSSLGLEYFCAENDELWNSSNEELIELAKKEIDKLKLARPESVFDAFVIRTPKTYPVYSMDYSLHLNTIKKYLVKYKNLQCIGRNGMFKYNNMDHSILSGLLAVENILGAKHNLWEINTDNEYHEQAKTWKPRNL